MGLVSPDPLGILIINFLELNYLAVKRVSSTLSVCELSVALFFLNLVGAAQGWRDAGTGVLVVTWEAGIWSR